MNIYTKLREAVERSILGGTIEVVSEGTHSTVSYNNKTISPYLLLAELKKLEENPAGVDLGDDLKLAKEELEEMKHELRAKVGLPPLTKEEKDYYEGLRPKEEWWKTHATQLWFEDVDEDHFEANVGKLVAEARKKALEEVEEMISAYAQQAVQGHEAVAFNALKAELDEMMK